MPVRPLRPTDLPWLLVLSGTLRDHAIVAPPWSCGIPASGALSRLRLIRLAVGHPATGRRMWVATRRGRLSGLIVAQPRRKGLAWDVERLLVQDGSGSDVPDLLDRAVAHAGRCGARRVFVELSGGSDAEVLVRRGGFDRYTGTRLYRLSPGPRITQADVFEGRPRAHADDVGLFQLYCTAVPAPVRAAEALTMDEWRGLTCARTWRPGTARSPQVVWELGAQPVGWARLGSTQHRPLVEMLVDGRYGESVDRLLHYALLQVPLEATVHAVAREYQSSLIDALERSGFVCIGERDVFAKQLTARVWEPRLSRARVVVA